MNDFMTRREMLLNQNNLNKFSRLDLIVRKMFLDSLNTPQYQLHRRLYIKMQINRTGYKVHTNRLPWVEQFLILDRSFYKKGYLNEFPLVVNSDKHLINSSHRASLCLHHKIDKIPFLICENWQNHVVRDDPKIKTYFDYGEEWFLRSGFFRDELQLIQEKKYELFEDLNMFFYFILWPPSELFFHEIVSDIRKEYRIISNKKMKIDDLDGFIKDIYTIDNISEQKLNKKIHHINASSTNRNIMVLKVDLFGTKFRRKTNFPNVLVSIEAENIKKKI